MDGISGGNTINFFYDGNGNLNCETTAAACNASAINGVGWTSFNKPGSITHEGATNIAYSYDPEHNRIEMNAPGGLTKYLSDPASGVMTEHMGPTITPYVDRDYVMADGKMVAIVVTQSSQTTAIYFPVLDHLGSVSVIVDGNEFQSDGKTINPNYGKAIDRYSFDAWGEARDPSQWAPRSCSDNPQPPFTRGFTGQEHIPGSVCLINFNARIYNPSIGRFLSADPTVEAPYNPQDLNRYSYVLNDPLAFTDPSGQCFLGCFWQQSWFGPLLDIALVFVGLPWLESLTPLLSVSGTGLFAAFDAEGVGSALMVANAGIAGGISGYAATGKIGGALISAGSAAAFAGIVPNVGGAMGAAMGGGQVANAAGYLIAGGMVGGLTSLANHQNFTSGFLAGGVGSLAGPLMGPAPSIQGAVASSVLGGFAAVLGGGKFANGAMTAAFAYAAATCAEGGCKLNEPSNQLSGGSATGTQQENPFGAPDKVVILSSRTQNEGSYSFFYYQLEDASGDPLTGQGYSLAEEVRPANEDSPPSFNSNGEFRAMTNGVAQDTVGWVNVAPPQNADWFYNQTFMVEYQGQIYSLTSEFLHEDLSVNGTVTNTVTVIRH